MESEPALRVSAELPRVWVRPELQARRQRVSVELQERLACRAQASCLIEPSPREWLSPRPRSRADPPSASVPLTAAVTRGI